MGRRLAVGGSAETTVAAGEHRCLQGDQGLASRIAQNRLDDQDGPLVRALVIGGGDAAGGQRLPLRREGAMQLDELFAVHDAGEIDPAAGQELDRRGQHRREGRDRPQPVLVDERQLVLVQGIGPQADAQRVEHALLVGPGHALFLGGEIEDGGIGDGHGSSSPWSPHQASLCIRAQAADAWVCAVWRHPLEAPSAGAAATAPPFEIELHD